MIIIMIIAMIVVVIMFMRMVIVVMIVVGMIVLVPVFILVHASANGNDLHTRGRVDEVAAFARAFHRVQQPLLPAARH